MKRKNKVSFVDYDICNVSKCNPEKGICFAINLCEHHVIKQIDGAFHPPMIDWNLCQGCNHCAKGCPLNAIKEMRT